MIVAAVFAVDILIAQICRARHRPLSPIGARASGQGLQEGPAASPDQGSVPTISTASPRSMRNWRSGPTPSASHSALPGPSRGSLSSSYCEFHNRTRGRSSCSLLRETSMHQNTDAALKCRRVDPWAPCDLTEIPSAVQLDGGRISGINDIPSVACAFCDPGKASLCEDGRDASSPPTRKDRHSAKVVARYCLVVGVIPKMSLGPADDGSFSNGHHDLSIRIDDRVCDCRGFRGGSTGFFFDRNYAAEPAQAGHQA
ncbi:hypothetical protein QFZ33_002895 [Arthrobacter globiformis]|nr:hypothetical protein [Arthrobacter globiformis]